MELRFGEEDNRKDGKRKKTPIDSHRQTGDLLKDLYGDLYRPGVQAGEADPAGKSQGGRTDTQGKAPDSAADRRAQSTLEQEMDALSRAQAALMEAAMKFNRENDIPVPGAVTGQASEKSVFAGKASAEEDSKTEVRQQAETQQAQADEKKPETDPMEDLNELIGLTGIKHDVRELYDFTKIQKLRKDAGMKTVPVSMHLVFTGNPGTGKTTVARILARLYKQIGVLSTGQLVECDRSGLVAGYVGQTAVKTQKKIEEAMGGVLFIDEAYSLARSADQGTDFGQEAIDTILKAMEDHRDEFVVIVAGYTKPMETFIHSNPGLQSRFNKFIEFPDYTVDELLAIFDLNCRKYEYVPDPEAREQVKTLLMLRKAQMTENFANAREVRNLFETIITNQARRIAVLEHPTKEEMQKITLEDLRDEGDSSGKSKESEKADEVEAAHEPEKTNETET